MPWDTRLAGVGGEELHLPSVLSLPCHHRTRRVPDSDPLGLPVPGHRVLRVRDKLLAANLVNSLFLVFLFIVCDINIRAGTLYR